MRDRKIVRGNTTPIVSLRTYEVDVAIPVFGIARLCFLLRRCEAAVRRPWQSQKEHNERLLRRSAPRNDTFFASLRAPAGRVTIYTKAVIAKPSLRGCEAAVVIASLRSQ